MAEFSLYQEVRKSTGDYTFEGRVISVMKKIAFHPISGFCETDKVRYAVQNREGLIHIFSEGQLEAFR